MALYKYVKADRIDILRNGLIRFTQPSALNDPWEFQPYIDKLMSDEVWENEIRNKAMEHLNGVDLFKKSAEDVWKGLDGKQRRAITPQLIEAVLRMRLRNDPTELERAYATTYEMIVDEVVSKQKEVVSLIPALVNKTLGILSLTEDPAHRLMWSHYADTFAGFVISFDESHSFLTTRRGDQDDIGGLRKVIYSPERPKMRALIDFSDEHLSTASAKFFFTKGKEWAYELEWRVMRFLEEADKIDPNPDGDIHLFTLPPAAVTGVILGHRMKPECRSAIIELLKDDERYGHVSLSETVLSETSYDVEIRPI